MQITKQDQVQIFSIMVQLINTKGKANKMVSIFSIHKALQEQHVETSKLLIESILDVLIQHKLVRYFTNDRNYTYYGITALGWTRWTSQTTQDEVATTHEQSEQTNNTTDDWKPIIRANRSEKKGDLK